MVKSFCTRYFSELKTVLDAVNLNVLEKIIDLLLNAYQKENQIFVMGNGGSAATASHFACDINKGVSYPLSRKFKVISLCDNLPLITAYSNDFSYENVFVEQLKNYLKAGDIVIGISCSGNSQNVLKAIKYANENRAITIGLTGFDGGLLAKMVQVNLHVLVEDMQKSEDIHLIVLHLIMQILREKLRKNENNPDDLPVC